MRLTVLGKSPAWQDAGGACSGYLVEDGDTTVLVDCGNGVFGKLRERCDYLDVDAVVISHMHADHTLDLVPYAYALTYSPRQQPLPVGPHDGREVPARPVLHAPPGAAETLRQICSAWNCPELIEHAFHLREYDPAESVTVGNLVFTFGLVPHYIPTYAIRMTSGGGSGPCITYGADCRPNDAIVAFAQDSDLLILEATLARPERNGERGHLTGVEAGDHARRAGARRLVITHIPDEIDQQLAHEDAGRAFGGQTDLATEGAVFEV